MEILGKYIFKPWIAGQLHIAGDREVQVGNDTFKTAVFTPEISLKIGWYS